MRLLNIVISAERDGETAQSALSLALPAVLVARSFSSSVPSPGKPSAHQTPPALPRLSARCSRLSYFLWSSMPDDELLRLASQGALHRADVLEAQVKRMLLDRRSRALAEQFASQWLETRKLASFAPDPKLFPDFDAALKAAMLAETGLFFASIVDEDRSVLELLDADFTFVNERLARHYGLSGVLGAAFAGCRSRVLHAEA